MASVTSVVDAFNSSATVNTAAGKIPQAPAVGAAQIFPMDAFTSEQESARAIAFARVSPQSVALVLR